MGHSIPLFREFGKASDVVERPKECVNRSSSYRGAQSPVIYQFAGHWLGNTLIFYCVNTSYPMDNSLSGRRGPARQTSEKDVLCLHRLGRPSTVHSPDGVSYFLPV